MEDRLISNKSSPFITFQCIYTMVVNLYFHLNSQFIIVSTFQTAPLMLSVSSFSAASYDKYIFVIGGGPNGKLATNNMQCFDSLSNKWSFKCPMPTEAKCTNAVTFKDDIFVIGLCLLHFFGLNKTNYSPEITTLL